MLKKLLVHLFMSLITDYARRGGQLLKIEGARYYVQAVSTLRRFVILVCLSVACLVVAQVGLTLFVYGLVSSLVVDPQMQALTYLIVGFVLVSVPLAYLLYINSERVWAERTGVPELLSSVVSPEHLEIRRKNRHS